MHRGGQVAHGPLLGDAEHARGAAAGKFTPPRYHPHETHSFPSPHAPIEMEDNHSNWLAKTCEEKEAYFHPGKRPWQKGFRMHLAGTGFRASSNVGHLRDRSDCNGSVQSDDQCSKREDHQCDACQNFQRTSMAQKDWRDVLGGLRHPKSLYERRRCLNSIVYPSACGRSCTRLRVADAAQDRCGFFHTLVHEALFFVHRTQHR